MFKFLTKYNVTTIKKNTRFETHKELIKIELFKVLEYYRNKQTASQTTIFSRLIHRLRLSESLQDLDYLERIESVEKSVSHSYDFSDVTNAGKPINGHGLPCNHLVILLERSDIFDIMEMDWKEISPLKPSGFTNTDVSLSHPSYNMKGIDVLTLRLNIKELMYQYKHWEHDRLLKGLDNDPNIYVQQYLFTNMIPYLLDAAIFTSILNKRPLTFSQTHPFHIRDMSKIYTPFIDDVYYFIKKRKISYAEVLLNIPLLTFGNCLEYTRLESNPTKQDMWVFTIIYLPFIYRLMKTSGKKYKSANNRAYSELKIFLTIYTGNKSYRLPKMDNYNTYFEYILRELKKDADVRR